MNLFNEYDIEHVIHFAAESHVDNSIKNPMVFVEANIHRNSKSIGGSEKTLDE